MIPSNNAVSLSLPPKNSYCLMKVFKFGGASVNSVERIKNVAEILRHYPNEELVIIISAMGKITNALEKVVQVFYEGKKDEALRLFEEIKQQHLTTAKYLLVTHWLSCENLPANMIIITTRWYA